MSGKLQCSRLLLLRAQNGKLIHVHEWRKRGHCSGGKRGYGDSSTMLNNLTGDGLKGRGVRHSRNDLRKDQSQELETDAAAVIRAG